MVMQLLLQRNIRCTEYFYRMISATYPDAAVTPMGRPSGLTMAAGQPSAR